MEPFLSGLTAPRLRTALDQPDQRVLCIVADGALAGMLRLDLSVWERHRCANVHTLFVDPALRGRGVAVAALRALLADLTARGAHRVQAEAYGFNTAALRTFAAAGFQHEGTRRAAWWRHDAWQDGLHLGWVAPPPTEASAPVSRAAAG